LGHVEESLFVRGAHLEDRLVGIGIADPILRRICFVGVTEAHRRKGIGSALLGALLEALGTAGRPARGVRAWRQGALRG
jgi:GNAT superfamily N-acetyltransferase